MAILKCKMCGGDLNLIEGASTAECEYCGSVQTVPKVDDEKKLTLFARANRLRAACEFDKAAGIYEAIVADFPEEAEAYWGLVLCKYGIEYVDDPATGKKIPTCHRSSFDNILEDDNYEQALENATLEAKKLYRQEAKALEDIRKGIVEVSAKEEPYDIFICYKETDPYDQRTLDSSLAYDIYELLTEKGYRVFFSRITLEDKLGIEYEPFIFAALNSAKIMLAFGTDVDYFDAVWVKNEWSRFLKLMAKDRSKHLIPCYKLIDPEDMPKEFRRLQGADMGRIGWEKDLLRGIEKLLPKKKETQTAVKETVVVQQAGGTNANAFVKRGNMALEDKMWDKADGFFEEALNHDAECAEAYVGKFLAEKKQTTLQNWADNYFIQTQSCQSRTAEVSRNADKEQALLQKYSLNGFGYADRSELGKILSGYNRTYTINSDSRGAQLKQAKQVFDQDRLLSRGFRFAKGGYATEISNVKKGLITKLEDRAERAKREELNAQKRLTEGYLVHLRNAEAKFVELLEKAQKIREEQYARFCGEQAKTDDANKLEQLSVNFLRLGDYKDAQSRAADCRNRCNQLREAQRQERERIAKAEAEERRRAKEAQERKEKQARTRAGVITFLLIAAVVAGIVFGVTSFLNARAAKRADAYAAAESLYASGDLDGAINAFKELGKYEDAAERVVKILYEKAEGLMAAGHYDRAIEVFTEISAFSDSEERILEAKYQIAMAYVNAGDHQKAIAAWVALGDYGDAKQQLLTVWDDFAERKTVALGLYHAVAITTDGTVMAAGKNDKNQCEVGGWTDITAVACGYYHTVGLKADGTVVATGFNTNGQCDVSGWTDIVAIAAAGYRTAGLRSDGTVVFAGDEMWDGNCSEWTGIVSIAMSFDHLIGIKTDGTAVVMMDNRYSATRAKDWTNLVSISMSPETMTGQGNTLGLNKNGTVRVDGDHNDDAAVTSWANIVKVSAGTDISMGLQADGKVKFVDHSGRLDYDFSGWTNIVDLICDGYDGVVGLREDGTLLIIGIEEDYAATLATWSNIKLPNK